MICVSSHTVDETLLPEAPVVLDIGARHFHFTRSLLALRPKAIVHAIEPDPGVADPQIANVTLHQLGLVHDDRRQQGYAMYSTGEGNYLTHLPWLVHDARIVTVPTMNLVDFSVLVGVPHWDLIKFDCEGAEFLILENWSGTPGYDQMSIEFHDFNTLKEHDDTYYQKLWEKLKAQPLKFDLTDAGPGIQGHWDCLLKRRAE